jgi:membrane protease YdiL (CAAX protease family)
MRDAARMQSPFAGRLPAARFVTAVLPVALILAGMAAAPARWPVLAVLLAGLRLLAWRRDEALWLWAALVPLAVRIAWAGSATSPLPGLADCGNALSAPVVARVVEAALVVGTLAIITVVLRAGAAGLSVRLPSRRIVALSIVGPVVVTPVALLVGPPLAGPFFGPVRIELGIAGALLPALFLGAANAVMEEVTFRGAIQGWGARVLGPTGALLLQAALFGLAHAGPDFLNPLVELPILVAAAAGGLIAGLIVQRTGSLLLPIAIHLALDIPLYYAVACRVPG